MMDPYIRLLLVLAGFVATLLVLVLVILGKPECPGYGTSPIPVGDGGMECVPWEDVPHLTPVQSP